MIFSTQIRAVRDRLQLVCSGDGGKLPDNLKDILIDLSCYDSDGLVHQSLSLLTRMHFVEDSLFSHAAHAQLIITKKSVTAFDKVKLILPQLRQLLSVDCDVDGQKKIVEILETLSGECTLCGGKEPNKENQMLLYNYGMIPITR